MTEPMSRRDREDLQKVARMRARVAIAGIAEQEARLLAEAEAQLSARYDIGDEAWGEVTAAAKAAVEAADAQVAEVCRARGIPEEFRPGLSLGWYGRGENAIAARRAELRTLAKAKIAAVGKEAKTAIEARTADVIVELISGGLESDAARVALASIPTPAQLMPTVDIAAIEAASDDSRTGRRRGL